MDSRVDYDAMRAEVRLTGTGVTLLNPAQAEISAQAQLQLFTQWRPLLFAVAYRMLGSAADAEDMLQETFIRWQRTSEVEVESPRALLVTIITRLCINHLQSARVTRENYFGQWLPEPVLTGPVQNPSVLFEIGESLSLAFLLLLERLTPVERAVLLLRDVFDYEYSEIALIVGRTESNCRQVLRRARRHIKENRPRYDSSSDKREELLQKFSEASSRGDLKGLVAILAEDAVFYSDGGGIGPALPNPIYGAERIARGILEGSRKLVPRNLIRRFVQLNGQPGILSFLDGKPHSVFTFDMADGRIANLYVISNPEKLRALPSLELLPV